MSPPSTFIYGPLAGHHNFLSLVRLLAPSLPPSIQPSLAGCVGMQDKSDVRTVDLFSSQFEGTAHPGGEGVGSGAASHTASTVRRQQMNAGTLFVFSVVFPAHVLPT